MLPIVAIVGRPNVGKSTLFNRLTKTRSALVSDVVGLTRDRQYGVVENDTEKFIVVDTGGFTVVANSNAELKSSKISHQKKQDMANLIADQAWQAINEANLVLFVVDARDGLTHLDEELIQKIRKANKIIWLLVNKIDGLNVKNIVFDYVKTGIKNTLFISAEHGDGVKRLISDCGSELYKQKDENIDDDNCENNFADNNLNSNVNDNASEDSQEISDEENDEYVENDQRHNNIKIAIIGRPNVGKSTLVNRILGEERVLVSDFSGTTRDSIFIDFQRRNKNYTLIDTAGIRKRGRVSEKIEKFSVIKALQAIEASNVVILVMDARENITEQDLHLLGFAINNGKAIVIAINKWDGLDGMQKTKIRSELERRLVFIDFAPIHFISALHGSGVGKLFPDIDKAYESATKPLKTPMVTKILQDAVNDFPPPLVNGRRIKLRYAHVGGHNPPIIVIHGNQTESVPVSYKKYLERIFRKRLRLVGTPIRIEFKTSYNPYQS